MKAELTGQCFIGGQWQAGDLSVFGPENPGIEQTGWQGVGASSELVASAVVSARAAFNDWSLKHFKERETLCLAFAELIAARSAELAELIHIETGKPRWESKTEAATVVAKVATSIEAYQQRTGTSATAASEQTTILTHRPQGVLAVLGPYNFPAHLPNGHIVPALLAGNTIVFKPSERTPAVAEFMVRCWQDVGLPNGVLNLLQGGGETGQSLAQNDDLDGLLFTGSSHTGAALHKAFGGQPRKMLALEMGGNNPLVVEQVDSSAAAVFTILQSAFISAGQRCTCARRLILLDNEQNRELLARLVTATGELKVGFDDDCFYGPVISEAAAQGLLSAQDRLVSLGAKPLLKAERLHQHKPLLSPAIIDVTGVENLPDEEYFGPLLQVHWVEDIHHALKVANDTRFGLSAGLLSDNKAVWELFYSRINAGIVNWNKPITGASGKNPFGGTGASGNHRPSGFFAADYCANPVASVVTESLQMPTQLLPGVTV